MKKFIASLSLLFLLSVLAIPPTIAQATGDANAVVDILNNPRYEGAMESIQGLTSIVDAGFTMFITFIAFFIISVAMLRNVLAGAYCAYPKFWDKVDVAHKEVQDTGWVTRIKGLSSSYQNINSGSLMKAVLRLLPNIKEITEFEDDSIEPKAYFIKAIPQMIGVVIIGVFIYNGYYKDTAAVVSNFGSELFKRVILSADPVAIFDRVTGATGSPEFSTDSAEEDSSKMVNKISKKSYSKVISTYSDISGSANKSAVAQQVETWVSANIDKYCADYTDSNNWKYSYDVTMTVGSTTQNIGASKSSDGLDVAVVFDSLSMKSLNLDSTKQVDVDWYINVVVNFKKKASKTETVRVNDFILEVGIKNWTASSYSFSLPSGSGGFITNKSTGPATITINKKDYDVYRNNNTLVISGLTSISSGTYQVVGLKYNSNAVAHTITTIKIVTGSQTANLSSTANSITSLAYGGEVVQK